MYVFVFFFFKQKTAYEMRISDWSSDVCSSDLLRVADREFGADFGFDRGAIACIDTAEVRPGVTVLVVDEGRAGAQFLVIRLIADPAAGVEHALADAVDLIFGDAELRTEVRRSEDRKSDAQGKRVVVRVDLWGCRYI